MDPLGDHVVIWHHHQWGPALDHCIDQLLNSESFDYVPITNHKCQAFNPTAHTRKSFGELTDYFKSTTYADINTEHLFPLLQNFQKALGTGCVIHVYDREDVNQAVLQPTNPPMKAWLAFHGYEKYTLYSQHQLSAYLFIPHRDVAFTPPHSHHSKQALTSTWGLYETSVSLPECIQSQLLPTL